MERRQQTSYGPWDSRNGGAVSSLDFHFSSISQIECSRLRNANWYRHKKPQEKSLLFCQGLEKGHPRKKEAYLTINTLVLQNTGWWGGWSGNSP